MEKRYSVKQTSVGRAGWIIYSETSQLKFPWEVSSTGIAVTIPACDEWIEFCNKNGAQWASGRRWEIIERIANYCAYRRYWGGSFEIGETWIAIYPNSTFIGALFGRLMEFFK